MGHAFDPSLLRDYDMRGRVGHTLSAADATAVGRSFATIVRRAGGRRIVVGRDGRTHSPLLEDALVDGIVAAGADVVGIGVGPSPMLYFAEATSEGVDGGIQVTGSHNPREDNGFKFVHRHGPFFGDDIRALAAIAAAGDWERGVGTVIEADVGGAYVDRLLRDAGPAPLRIGWDAGNGAAGAVIEALTKRLPGEHHLLFTHIDGNFPNHHPDPTVVANLADLATLVVDKKLDFGLAFDGDGDRIGAVDGSGKPLWGDEILAILAGPLLRACPGAAIVADVKSSQSVFDHIAALGGRPVMWRTGHSQVKAKMREVGAPLAGEMSGHIFFAHDYYGFDDALYAAIRLIDAVGQSGRPLAALRDDMPPRHATPEWRVPVAEERKAAIVATVSARLRGEGAVVDETDGVRVRTDDGWWLMRASNTEAALTLRAEARDATGLTRLIAAIDTALAACGIERTPAG